MYVRVSISRARGEHEQEVIAIEDDLLGFFSSLEGYVDGFRVTSGEHIGRVTIWDSEHAADEAANAQHTLAVRSERIMLVEADSFDLGMDGVRFAKK